ncbi:MAG TPA: hypothetical protein VGF53_15775 [Pseudolabrys sp.]|jgi:hypothetical protein
MQRTIKRTALWVSAALAVVVLSFIGLIAWPDPLFAYSFGAGKIVIASDRSIPAAGGERLLRDCEKLLERSPLKAEGRRYHLYIANEDWRHRLFLLPHLDAGGIEYYFGFWGTAFLSGADFDNGRHIKWGYVAAPPRTLAYFCAHELTHIVVDEHIGVIGKLRLAEWVHEGFPDYVAIENRQSFEQLRDALGESPVDVRMTQTYGSYPRYRLLVSYFLEKKGWSVEQLLATRLSIDEALAIMRANEKR